MVSKKNEVGARGPMLGTRLILYIMFMSSVEFKIKKHSSIYIYTMQAIYTMYIIPRFDILCAYVQVCVFSNMHLYIVLH